MHYSVTAAQIWEALSSALALNNEKELQRLATQSGPRKLCLTESVTGVMDLFTKASDKGNVMQPPSCD